MTRGRETGGADGVARGRRARLVGMTDFHARDFLGLIGDERLEPALFACLADGLSDGRVASLFSVAGWGDDFDCFAVGGTPRDTVEAAMVRVHRAVHDLGGTGVVAGVRDGWLVAAVRRQGAAGPEVTCTAMEGAFDPDRPLCLGPLRRGVRGAAGTVRAVLVSLKAAPAVPHLPRPTRADDVLPERALLGDDDARRELVEGVYGSMAAAGPDDPTLTTVAAFLASGGSLESTAKELNVHPNTVRYRLKRAAESTGWDATDPREAYVLTTAIALGRIHDRAR